MDIIFRNVRIDDAQPLQDVAVHNGKIVEIAPAIAARAAQEIEGNGNVLIPGFVEGHLHLEKANVMQRKANRSGTLKEAIAVTAALKPTLTREDILERSTQVLRALVQAGMSAPTPSSTRCKALPASTWYWNCVRSFASSSTSRWLPSPRKAS